MPPSDPTTPPVPTEAAQAAHDALMARLVEACYIQAITLAKVADVPPRHIPRLLICAATHGIDKSIALFQRRQELDAAGVPFRPEDRAALHVRILEDLTELEQALVEAGEAIDAIKTSFVVTPSTLIS